MQVLVFWATKTTAEKKESRLHEYAAAASPPLVFRKPWRWGNKRGDWMGEERKKHRLKSYFFSVLPKCTTIALQKQMLYGFSGNFNRCGSLFNSHSQADSQHTHTWTKAQYGNIIACHKARNIFPTRVVCVCVLFARCNAFWSVGGYTFIVRIFVMQFYLVGRRTKKKIISFLESSSCTNPTCMCMAWGPPILLNIIKPSE